MRPLTPPVLSAFVLILLAGGASPAVGQSGFGFKVGGVFNSSTVEERETDLRMADAAGWNLGIEYVSAGGLGLGLSGYTTGSPAHFDRDRGSFVVLADANYFLRIPLLPIAPYAGVNMGMGTYRLEDVQGGVRPRVGWRDRGHQYGVRFQPTSILGIDAQFRRVSGSLADEQGRSFETRQVVLGVTLF
ncbi:hypothetical protein BH23GEM6_BH23GEM6_23640 [soil metagenome]